MRRQTALATLKVTDGEYITVFNFPTKLMRKQTAQSTPVTDGEYIQNFCE